MTTKLLDRPTVPDLDDDATRREFVGGLVAAGLLAACGRRGGSPEAGPTTTGPTTRSFAHTEGATEVPIAPVRVAALDGILSSGPGGSRPGARRRGEDLRRPVGRRGRCGPKVDVSAAVQITDDSGPNVEALASLRPDLIVGTDLDKESYAKLAPIAPTVPVARGQNGEWRARFRSLADAVNRAEAGAKVEASYEREIARLPARARSTEVAFVRPASGGQFRIDSFPAAFAGSVARDAGIPLTTSPAGVGTIDAIGGYAQYP